jgi:hypothetical protein
VRPTGASPICHRLQGTPSPRRRTSSSGARFFLRMRRWQGYRRLARCQQQIGGRARRQVSGGVLERAKQDGKAREQKNWVAQGWKAKGQTSGAGRVDLGDSPRPHWGLGYFGHTLIPRDHSKVHDLIPGTTRRAGDLSQTQSLSKPWWPWAQASP